MHRCIGELPGAKALALLLRPCHVYAADVTAANQLQLLVPCKHKAPSGFWQPSYHPALAELHASLFQNQWDMCDR